jgi:hypothetical protein
VAPVTNEANFISQSIEGDLISDFAFGTPNAQPVTLSFWANSSLTGTFSGVLRSYWTGRSCPFAYSLPAANTWTRISVTIPGDTGGTWGTGTDTGELNVVFDVGSGPTNRGPAGAWSASAYYGATGAQSIIGTNGATFYVTGVKLEIGSVATPFNRQSLAKSLADCQRYYQTSSTYMILYNGVASALFGHDVQLFVPMRSTPTIVYVSPSYVNASGIATNGVSASAIQIYATGTAVGTSNFLSGYTASAEL